MLVSHIYIYGTLSIIFYPNVKRHHVTYFVLPSTKYMQVVQEYIYRVVMCSTLLIAAKVSQQLRGVHIRLKQFLLCLRYLSETRSLQLLPGQQALVSTIQRALLTYLHRDDAQLEQASSRPLEGGTLDPGATRLACWGRKKAIRAQEPHSLSAGVCERSQVARSDLLFCCLCKKMKYKNTTLTGRQHQIYCDKKEFL